MSKYSILFEAERFHEIGPFRFPVYEDLTPGEAKGIEALNKLQSKSTYKSMRLAQRIANDRKIPVKEALEVLSHISEEENADVLFKYADDVEALSAESISATEQKIQFVTLFMKYRGETKLPPNNSIDDNWNKTTDWKEIDTEGMPTKLLEKVFDMILWERDGWPTEGNEPSPMEPKAVRTRS